MSFALPTRRTGIFFGRSIDWFGSCPWCLDSTRSDIVYLGEKDIKATLDDIAATIESSEEKCRRFKSKQYEREILGARPFPGIQNQIDYLTKSIEECTKK
jgi:hypothetical protein